MNNKWENLEGIKQLLILVLLGIIILYAGYNQQFKFLEGLVAGLFAALNLIRTPSKGE